MHGIHKLDIPLLSALKLFYQTHPRKKNKSLQKVKNIGFTDMFCISVSSPSTLNCYDNLLSLLYVYNAFGRSTILVKSQRGIWSSHACVFHMLKSLRSSCDKSDIFSSFWPEISNILALVCLKTNIKSKFKWNVLVKISRNNEITFKFTLNSDVSII